jgi:CxxC motif-containing protein
MEVMHLLSKVTVKPPIKMAQVIVPNIAGTGVDMVSTDELFE